MKNLQEAQEEANKCLNCKVPMCQKGCPISTNIPQFIEQIKNGNLEEAYKILQENNMIKGAAGQAIQNMNIAFGFEEDAGLNMIPPAF